MRVKVQLRCTECKSKNYSTTKNKRSTSKLELRKFCPRCGKHVLHKETK